MSSELMKKISGKLTDAQGAALSKLPYGITIEFNTTLTPPGPGGWIGSAPVKATGDYELFTAYDISSKESITYDIYKEDQPVKTGTVLVQNNVAADIALTQDELNELMVPDLNACIVVKGSVTLKGIQNVANLQTVSDVPSKDNVMAAVPLKADTAKISISKVKLRDNTEIASGSIDAYGNYSIKIPANLVNQNAGSPSDCNECCSQNDLSKINVSLIISTYVNGDYQDYVLEKVSNVPLSMNCTTVDIQTQQQKYFGFFKTELDYVSNLVNTTTGLPVDQYYTVTTEGNDAEINQVAEESGLPVGLVATLINASKTTHDYGIVINQSYALTKYEGADISAWTKLDLTALTDVINTGIYNRITTTEGNVNDTYTILNNKKIDDNAAVVTDNGDTINQVLGTLLSSEADIKTFLSLDDQYAQSDPQTFWAEVDAQLPGQTAVLQQGLQVLSITGMQPELTSHIMELLGKPKATASPEAAVTLLPTSTLVTYTQDQWKDMIVAGIFSEPAVAWKVIENCGPSDNHPFVYPINFMVSASDAYGNYTPLLAAFDGQRFEMVINSAGAVLQLSTHQASKPTQVEIENRLVKGAINAYCLREGKPIAVKTNLAPGQKAVFEFRPKIFIGVALGTKEGEVMDAATTGQIITELDLFGISSADIVMTGGGSGTSSKAFNFSLQNINR